MFGLITTLWHPLSSTSHMFGLHQSNVRKVRKAQSKYPSLLAARCGLLCSARHEGQELRSRAPPAGPSRHNAGMGERALSHSCGLSAASPCPCRARRGFVRTSRACLRRQARACMRRRLGYHVHAKRTHLRRKTIHPDNRQCSN